MDCLKVEPWLSEYMDASLPADEMALVKGHLESCQPCSALLQEMQSAASLCHSYLELEIDHRFVERILLRTSGRPRTRSFKELFQLYFIRPLLTPRLAAGASLAVLFLVLMLDLMLPKLSVTLSNLSPGALIQFLDRGAQRVYGEGLRAYNKKNEWQAELGRFKKNTLNSLRSLMDQLEAPVEGRKKSEDPAPRKESSPQQKSSNLPSWPT